MFDFLLLKLTEIFRREHSWAEFWSAMVALIWAGLAMWEPQVVGAPAYDALYASVSPSSMAIIGILVFVAQMGGFATNRVTLRWFAAALASWFYTMLLQSFFAAGVSLPNIAPWVGYVGINLFVCVRLPLGLR